MPDLLALSARIVDSGVADEPTNRVTQELSEVADGVAVAESSSHCVVLALRRPAHRRGLVALDSSGAARPTPTSPPRSRGRSGERGCWPRAQQLAEAGDLRLGCQLAEWAGQAAPDDAGVRAVRAAVHEQRHRCETSLMAEGIYRSAAQEG